MPGVDHLLIGGGVAAAACARALREGGASGSVTLLARELDPPYRRPPATKEYLRGVVAKEDAHVLPESWYGEHDVELRTRTGVRSIDPAAKTVKLQGGDEIEYETALLATGSLVKRLPVDGDDLEGIQYVRALGNADAVRRDAEDATEAVLIGGSYIGCEVAASLTTMGKTCTIVMQEDEPMERAFGKQLGQWVRKLLEDRGITVLGGEQLDHFEGDGRLAKVVTASGKELAAQMAVLGTGVNPDVMLARAAKLDLGEGGGVLCDAHLRTSADGLFAAGDICEYASPVHGRHIRVEHEDVAEHQGETVAKNMMGEGVEYTEVPYFWTDLADWATLEYVGPAQTWDEEIVRGEMRDGQFSVLYLDGGSLVACAACDRGDDLEAAKAIIAAGGDVGDTAALADASKPLPTP